MPVDLDGLHGAGNQIGARCERFDFGRYGCNQCGVVREPYALGRVGIHSGEVCPFGLGQVNRGIRENQRALGVYETPHMIAMNMRDENVRDALRIDARGSE